MHHKYIYTYVTTNTNKKQATHAPDWIINENFAIANALIRQYVLLTLQHCQHFIIRVIDVSQTLRAVRALYARIFLKQDIYMR